MNTDNQIELATFAGGCFWCMVPPYEECDGVVAIYSGYAGGQEESPTYQQVSAGITGHIESIQIRYDSRQISYQQLLEIYWRQIDPTTPNRQFMDEGRHYRTAIFYHNEQQRLLAEKSKESLEHSGLYSAPVVTEIMPYTGFYPAEEYHQQFHKKNPAHYKRYRHGSGRDQFLERIWGKTE